MSFINLHSPLVSITSTQKWKRGFNVPRALPATGSAQTGDGAAGRNTIKPGLHGHICPYIWRVGYISRYICRVGYMSRYWALARHARDLSDTHVTWPLCPKSRFPKASSPTSRHGVLSVSSPLPLSIRDSKYDALYCVLQDVEKRQDSCVPRVCVCVCACPGLGSMADTLQQRHPAQRLEEACRRFSCNLFDIEEGHVGQMQRAPCTLRHSFCAIHFVPFTVRHSLCAIHFAFHFD